MSPGPTFERVYLELKRQLREGTRPLGTPLEPTAIGDELGTSFTPVRDALHRLVGEGLVETPRHNGFAVPHPTEQALRDLYAWNNDVLSMIVRKVKSLSEPLEERPEASGAAEGIAGMFIALAEASGNREHVRAIAHLNERLAPFRHAEGHMLADYAEEVAGLSAKVREAGRGAIGRDLARYHKRRIECVPTILEALRPLT